MKKVTAFILGLFLVSLSGFCTSSHAVEVFEPGFTERFTDSNNWEFQIASGVRSVPKYEGSDNREAQFLIYANASFDDGRFFIGTSGIGIEPIRTERLRLMLGIGYEWGRDESDDRENLRGLGDVDDSFTGKARLTYALDMMRLGLGVSSALNGDYGTTAELFADSRIPLTKTLALNWKVFTQWADDEHMENYFGVNERQSLRSGKRAYNAESGFKKVGLEMGMDLRVFRNLGVGVAASATQLLGDAADSPICRDETQLEGRLFLSLGF